MIRALLHPSTSPAPLTLEIRHAIVSQARREAAEILTRAKKRARTHTRRAQERGYDDGLRKGEAQGRDNFIEVIQKMREHYSAAAELARNDVTTVASHILEQTIASHLESNPSCMQLWINEAIDNLKTSRALTLRYHPRYEIILSELLPSLSSRITPLLDPSVGDADFILEGPSGGVAFAWRELLHPLYSLQRSHHEPK